MRLAPPVSADRIESDLTALAEFHDLTLPGWTRRAFSQPGVAGRTWIANQMTAAGLMVQRDGAGNLIGTRPGRCPALVTGSHTDTVEGGGRFDGIAGVLAALEVVRAFNDANIALKHELRVVDFFNEEPNPFGLSCVGSRAASGALTDDHLRLTAPDGETMASGLERVGTDPRQAVTCRWDPMELGAFVELHVEQGPRLQDAQVPVGLVTAIAGIHRLRLRFTGQADHAGTTPMDRRHDALLAAAEAALAAERLAVDGGGVATAGQISVQPGAMNVVPAEAVVWIEMRSPDAAWLQRGRILLETMAGEVAARRGLHTSIEWMSGTAPVPVPDNMQAIVARACQTLDLPYLQLFSGAGHDAAFVARIAPMAMIFVPSQAGRSHCPEEFTSTAELATGARALGQTLLLLDEQK